MTIEPTTLNRRGGRGGDSARPDRTGRGRVRRHAPIVAGKVRDVEPGAGARRRRRRPRSLGPLVESPTAKLHPALRGGGNPRYRGRRFAAQLVGWEPSLGGAAHIRGRLPGLPRPG